LLSRQKTKSLVGLQLATYLKTNPGDADANYYLASTYHHLGRTAEARRQYDYIRKAFPGSSAATYASQGIVSLNTVLAKTAQSDAAKAYQDPDEDRVALRRGNSGHLLVNCKINGKNVELAFDTGAEKTCLTLDAWKRLGYAAPTEKAVEYASGIGGDSPMWSREAQVEVGKFKRTLDLKLLKEMPFDGLIGQNFFQDLQYNMSGNADYIHILPKARKLQPDQFP